MAYPITRQFGPNAKGSELTFADMDNNLLYLDAKASGSNNYIAMFSGSTHLVTSSLNQSGNYITISGYDLKIDNASPTIFFSDSSNSSFINIKSESDSINIVNNSTGYTAMSIGANGNNIYINDDTIVSGSLTVTGSLLQSGSTTLRGNSTITGSLTVTGSLRITGSITSTDSLTVTGSITSTGLIGYGTGSTVTQTTSTSSAVSINAVSGRITTFTTTYGAGSIFYFTVNNNQVNTDDIIILNIKSAPNNDFECKVYSVSGNRFDIRVKNDGTTQSGTVVISFAVLKGASS